jgi:hypothetical protein
MPVTEDSQAEQEESHHDYTLTVAAGALLLVHLTLKYLPAFGTPGTWPRDGGIDTTGLVLIAVALLPWASEHLKSFKLPGGIDFAFREVERRQTLAERAIRQLRFIVDGFLTRDEYKHLINIRDAQAQGYLVGKAESGVLASELRRLRSLGLITNLSSDRGVTDFTRTDDHRRKISEWFRLTPRGEEYLQMRADNEKVSAMIGAEPPADSQAPLPEKNAVLDRTKVED